ncbi:hypothetical protein AC1031_001653 [Aphanomyces cochlioides]|nr:hypothetical protein AC1031_001653 [Aphanomyces cochlioides]
MDSVNEQVQRAARDLQEAIQRVRKMRQSSPFKPTTDWESIRPRDDKDRASLWLQREYLESSDGDACEVLSITGSTLSEDDGNQEEDREEHVEHTSDERVESPRLKHQEVQPKVHPPPPLPIDAMVNHVMASMDELADLKATMMHSFHAMATRMDAFVCSVTGQAPSARIDLAQLGGMTAHWEHQLLSWQRQQREQTERLLFSYQQQQTLIEAHRVKMIQEDRSAADWRRHDERSSETTKEDRDCHQEQLSLALMEKEDWQSRWAAVWDRLQVERVLSMLWKSSNSCRDVGREEEASRAARTASYAVHVVGDKARRSIASD